MHGECAESQFALLIFVIRLFVGVLLESPPAVDVETVHHAVAVEPVEVLVDNRLAEIFKSLGVLLPQFAEQIEVDPLGHEAVASRGQMDAVDRERLLNLRVKLDRQVVQVDERNFGTAQLHIP